MPIWQLNVFLSYSRANSMFVDHLHSDLALRGFHVWMDRDKLEGGDEWKQKIASEILRSNVVLVVLSPAVLDSRWVREEVDYAQTYHKRIIPLLYQETVKPFGLTRLQHTDFTGSYEGGLHELIATLSAIRISTLPPDSVEAGDPVLQPDAPEVSAAQASERDRAAINRQLMALLNEAREVNGDLEREYELYQLIAQIDESFNADRVQEKLRELPKRIQEKDRQRLLNNADTAQEAGNWRTAIGAWQSLCAMEPANAGLRASLIAALRKAAEEAYNNGLWLEELSYWHGLQALVAGDPQAAYHVAIAEQNERHRLFYDNARDLTTAGKYGIARDDLDTLRKLAPDYCDYARLAEVVGIEPFISFADIEIRRQREDVERRQRAEAARDEAVRQDVERRQRAEAARLVAMQPQTFLAAVHKVAPQPSGWFRRKAAVLAGDPQFAVPRETLQVGEPFIARLSFQVLRQVVTKELALELIFSEDTSRRVRVTEYHYNRETKIQEPNSVMRWEPRVQNSVILQAYFEGGSYKRDELVVRDQLFRIPANAMHSFQHGSHALSWLLRLRLDFGEEQVYWYDYRISVAAEIYR